MLLSLRSEEALMVLRPRSEKGSLPHWCLQGGVWWGSLCKCWKNCKLELPPATQGAAASRVMPTGPVSQQEVLGNRWEATSLLFLLLAWCVVCKVPAPESLSVEGKLCLCLCFMLRGNDFKKLSVKTCRRNKMKAKREEKKERRNAKRKDRYTDGWTSSKIKNSMISRVRLILNNNAYQLLSSYTMLSSLHIYCLVLTILWYKIYYSHFINEKTERDLSTCPSHRVNKCWGRDLSPSLF